MKEKAKIFIIYFPVILVACQVLVNGLFFIAPTFYNKHGFYLNTFFGTNVLFAFFMLCFTFLFRFCDVSRWAAVTEFLFAVIFMIIKEDNVYNIVFQMIAGSVAIVLTFRRYIRKFPLCRLSLLFTFYGSIVTSKGDCKKGLERWEKQLTSTLEKKLNENRT